MQARSTVPFCPRLAVHFTKRRSGYNQSSSAARCRARIRMELRDWLFDRAGARHGMKKAKDLCSLNELDFVKVPDLRIEDMGKTTRLKKGPLLAIRSDLSICLGLLSVPGPFTLFACLSEAGGRPNRTGGIRRGNVRFRLC